MKLTTLMLVVIAVGVFALLGMLSSQELVRPAPLPGPGTQLQVVIHISDTGIFQQRTRYPDGWDCVTVGVILAPDKAAPMPTGVDCFRP